MKRLLLCMLIFLAFGAGAAEPDANLRPTLHEAAAAFDEGVRLLASDPAEAHASLRASVAAYESLLQAGIENGKLYYNLGNAHLLLGDTGRAVLNYRRAQAFIPTDPNLQANLADALSRVRADFDTTIQQTALDRLRRFATLAPLKALLWTALIAWAIAWTTMLIRMRVRSLPRWISASAMAIAVVSGGVVAARFWLDHSDNRAVIVASETVGRKGPDAGAYAPSFAAPLPAGVEARVLAQRPDWSLVRLPDARETWLATRDIAPLWQ